MSIPCLLPPPTWLRRELSLVASIRVLLDPRREAFVSVPKLSKEGRSIDDPPYATSGGHRSHIPTALLGSFLLDDTSGMASFIYVVQRGLNCPMCYSVMGATTTVLPAASNALTASSRKSGLVGHLPVENKLFFRVSSVAWASMKSLGVIKAPPST